MTTITVHCRHVSDSGDSFVVDVDDMSIASIHMQSGAASEATSGLKYGLVGLFLLKVTSFQDHATVSGSEVSLLPPVAGG